MDCEDSNWAKSGSGWIGNCSIDSNGNVTLVCCVVPAVSFKRCGFDYAVLDLNGNALPSGVNGFTRYIDNEDGNNINKTTLDGTTIGTLGKCSFNTNTTLAFQFYPKDGSNSTTCISYTVWPFFKDFGLFGKLQLPISGNITHYGSITSDDEDSGNVNSLSQNRTNVPTADCRTNIMPDGVNTTFNFTWMHFD